MAPTIMLPTLVLAALLVSCSCTTLEEEQINLANSNTAFGFNLLNAIQGQEGGNVFLSPFSISTALAMTYLGADGDTATQMASGLQISTYKNAAERFKRLNHHLFTDSSRGYSLRQANRLYGERNVAFKKDFLNDVKKYFKASLSKVDFSLDSTREDINLWVEEETDQKIQDLLKQGDLDDAILVLINAIYFKAFWEQPFDAYKTMRSQFNISPTRPVDVEMMRNTKSYNIGPFPGFPAKIIELKYTGDQVSMFVILPDEGTKLCDVQEGITMENLEAAITGMQQKTVRLQMPKFEVRDRFQLSTYLELLGMKDMFDYDKADFTKITDLDKVAVSKVIHESFVRVDENGTEAAAATAVIVTLRSSHVIADEEFTVDRPFLFFIREKQSQSVLFLGRVVDPWDNATLGADDYVCSNTQSVAYKIVEEPAAVGGNGSGHPVLSMYCAIMAVILVFLRQ